MFCDGPWNTAPASSPKSIRPRDSADSPLRVHTTNSVEPGWYSQRNTALPRSDRNVKCWCGTTDGGDGPAAAGSVGSPAATVVVVPTSTPYTSLPSPRGAANSL